MIRLSKDEFMEELKSELYGYEELEEEQIQQFLTHIEQYFARKKGKKNRISYGSNSITIQFKDESEIFKIADQFLAAVVNEQQDAFYQHWQL